MSDPGAPDQPDQPGDDALPDAAGRAKSPRRGMAAAVLTLEAIVLGLVTPVMISISHVDHVLALSIGLGLAVVSLLIAGLLRRPFGYTLGWILQVAAIVLGVVVPTMYFVGGLFALLWGSADLLGRKIDRERAEAYARFDAESAGSAGSSGSEGSADSVRSVDPR